MAYDESGYRRRDTDADITSWVGAGERDDSRSDRDLPYRADSDDRYPTGSLPAADPRDSGPVDATRRRSGVPSAVLDDVFDDPEHGEPGRDRIAVHLGWEAVLFVGVAVLTVLLYQANPAALRGAALDSLLVYGAALGLLALGAGVTLRTAAPNLALGPVAVASALHFAENGNRGVPAAVAPAAVAAAALGLAVALVVVVFHVPSWAVSLAAGLGVIVYIQQRSAPVNVQGDFAPTQSAGYLFGGFAALALLGGLFGSIKAVRRAVGRFRPVADPAQRRGVMAAVLTVLAITSSMGFAMLAGVLLAAGGTGPVAPTPGLEWTGLAFGAALLSGTSAFGRRGGIFGTVLAVVLLTLFITYDDARNWHIAPTAIAAVTMAVGLLVTRLVEAYGRPRSADRRQADAATTTGTAGGPTGREDANWATEGVDRPQSWSSTLPAQPVDSRHDDPWSTDRWGTTQR